MDTKQKLERFKEIETLVLQHESNKNFSKLPSLYKEIIELLDSAYHRLKYYPKKAYCEARLNDKEEALNSLNKLKEIGFLCDEDVLYRSVLLVHLFIDSKDIQSKMITNTIKSWLKDKDSSVDVKSIIFDYRDIVGETEEFDPTRLNKRKTFFSNELLDCAFSAMQRNHDSLIYYDRSTNDILQKVEGYFSSNLLSDQKQANIILRDKILNDEPVDHVIEGVHFLIPRLLITDYFEELKKHADDKLSRFIENVKPILFEIYSKYIDSLDDLCYSYNAAKNFYTEINKAHNISPFDEFSLNQSITKTQRTIAKNYLNKINELVND